MQYPRHDRRSKPLSRWLPLSLALAIIYTSSAQANSAPIALDDTVFHNGEVIVVDVLANDSEPDGESMTISTFSTTCDGALSEDLGLVTLLPDGSTSETCTISYTIIDESNNTASATVNVQSSGLLFKDGFESDDTSAWSDEEVAR